MNTPLRSLAESSHVVLPGQVVSVHFRSEAEGDGEDHPGEHMTFGTWRPDGSTPKDPEAPTVGKAAPKPAKAPAKPKRPTFDQAQGAILNHLEKAGYKVAKGLKIPHATSPDGRKRFWFKAQAVHVTDLDSERAKEDGHTRHELGNAHSTWGIDIRDHAPEDFLQHHDR